MYHCTGVLFGTAFNDLFLVHVALLPLSIAALVLLLNGVDTAGVRARFRPHTPARTVSALLVLVAAGLGGMWVYSALRFAVTGEPPDESELVLPAGSVHLAHVLDLGLLVPALMLGAVLLWRHRPWGYVLVPALLTYLVPYQVDYMAALAFQAGADVPGATAADPLEPFVAGALLVAAGAMFAGLRPGRPAHGPPPRASRATPGG